MGLSIDTSQLLRKRTSHATVLTTPGLPGAKCAITYAANLTGAAHPDQLGMATGTDHHQAGGNPMSLTGEQNKVGWQASHPYVHAECNRMVGLQMFESCLAWYLTAVGQD